MVAVARAHALNSRNTLLPSVCGACADSSTPTRRAAQAQPPSATSEGQAVVPQGMKKGDILEQIKAQRIKDVAAAKAAVPLEVLLKQIVDTPLKPIDFAARLRAALPTCVLAEVKRASPSKGIIAAGIDAAAQAVKYAEGGAAAISVLTEPTWFKGTLDDMLGAAKSVSAMVNRPVPVAAVVLAATVLCWLRGAQPLISCAWSHATPGRSQAHTIRSLGGSPSPSP